MPSTKTTVTTSRGFSIHPCCVLLYAAGLDDQNAKKLSDAISDARQSVKKVHCSLIDVTSDLSDTRGGQHRCRQRQRRSQRRCSDDELCNNTFAAEKGSLLDETRRSKMQNMECNSCCTALRSRISAIVGSMQLQITTSTS